MENKTLRVQEIYDIRRGWRTEIAQSVSAFGKLRHYRKKACKALLVGKGSTVLDLCCGSGPNTPYLRKMVGESGAIIGWDLSPRMLEVGQERARMNGWLNVHNVRGNAERIGLKPIFDGIVSTYSMSIVPDHKAVLRAAVEVLKPGGRLVIFDRQLKRGGALRQALNRIVRKGGSRWHADWDRTPWNDLEDVMGNVEVKDLLFGLYYIAWGIKK